jgi:hypothetical protein
LAPVSLMGDTSFCAPGSYSQSATLVTMMGTIIGDGDEGGGQFKTEGGGLEGGGGERGGIPVTNIYYYGQGTADIAYRFTLISPTNLFVDLCGSSFDTVAYLRTDPNDENTTLALNDDSNFCGNSSSSFSTGLLQPGTYYLIVDGYQPGAAGAFNLSISFFTPQCVVPSG